MGRPRSRPRGRGAFAQDLWALIDAGPLEISEATGVHVKTVDEWLVGKGPRTGEKSYRAAIDKALATRQRVTLAEVSTIVESLAVFGREATAQMSQIRHEMTDGFARLAGLFEQLVKDRGARGQPNVNLD